MGPPLLSSLVDLEYESFGALVAQCNLPPMVGKAVKDKNTSTEKVYRSQFSRALDEAALKLREGNEDAAYKLLNRCAHIAQIIINKHDFTHFKTHNPLASEFHAAFKRVLEQIEQLAGSLKRRYALHEEEMNARKKETDELLLIEQEQRRFGRDVTDVNGTAAVTNRPVSEQEIGAVVTPKQLVALINARQRSVVVVDYRDDRRRLEQPSCKDNSHLSVVHIPANLITSGCIASKLIKSLPVTERGLMKKLGEADLVVLMGDDDEANKENKTLILLQAITTYNTISILKRQPAVLEKGFANWKLHYPMHAAPISGVELATDASPPETPFEVAVANFLRQYSYDVEYPSLERPPAQILPVEMSGDENLASAASTREHLTASIVQPSRPSIPDRMLKPSLAPPPSQVSERTTNEPRINEATTMDVRSNAHTDDDEHSSTEENIAPVEMAQLEERKENIPQLPSIPSFDRSTKPTFSARPTLNSVDRNGDESRMEGGGSPHSKMPSLLGGKPWSDSSSTSSDADSQLSMKTAASSIPSVDRGTKPRDNELEIFQINLQKLYSSMFAAIRERGSPGRVHPGCTGLRNMGNTCFMNATLQALSNTPSLRAIFHTRDNRNDAIPWIPFVNRLNRFGTRGVVSAAFGALIDSMWSGNFEVINPAQFLANFAKVVNPEMGDRRQHDAQEFQILLLDALHEDLNMVSHRKSIEQNNRGKDLVTAGREAWRNAHEFSRSKVTDIFQLQTMSELCCSVCDERSVTFEEMTQLSLELPDNRRRITLYDCLKLHFGREVLDGSSRWHCTRCRRPQMSTKQTQMWRLPEVLVVHLKRFARTGSGFVKNETGVDFPLTYLDLSDFMHDKTDSRAMSYSLYAVTNHFGRLESGHYTSFAKNNQLQKWLRFDDEMVTTMQQDNVKTSAAYILFYTRDN